MSCAKKFRCGAKKNFARFLYPSFSIYLAFSFKLKGLRLLCFLCLGVHGARAS